MTLATLLLCITWKYLRKTQKTERYSSENTPDKGYTPQISQGKSGSLCHEGKS